MKRSLLHSTAFTRAAKRLAKKNPQMLAALRQAATLLQEDAFDPRLRTHKLKAT